MAKCPHKCGCEVGDAPDCGMCCQAAVERRERECKAPEPAPLPEPPPFVAPEVTCEGDHRGDCSLPPDHDGRCQLIVPEPPAPRSGRRRRGGS